MAALWYDINENRKVLFRKADLGTMRTNEEILKLAMEDYNTAMEDYTLVDRYGAGHSQGLSRIVSEVWANFGLTDPVEAIKREDIAPVIKELVEDFESEIGWVDDKIRWANEDIDNDLDEIEIDDDEFDNIYTEVDDDDFDNLYTEVDDNDFDKIYTEVDDDFDDIDFWIRARISK